MARSTSGRLVIEIDPALKRHLHTVLAANGLTLKEWFIRAAEDYLEAHDQLDLFVRETETGATENDRKDQ